MNIKRWDWDRQAFIEDEYPDALFSDFLNWLLTTKRWLEDPALVNRKVLALQRALAEHRQGPESHREPFEEDARVAPTEPVDGLAERRRANLVKARAARAAKKAQREAVSV